MKFESFEQAKTLNSPECFIPAHFTETDEDYKTVTVKLGTDANEQTNQVGKAATQKAKSHFISIRPDEMLHIIDTPGIGDPEGIDRDQDNMQNTIKYISDYKQIHGVCVLLKPNNTRLHTQFRYCFKELLLYLHKNHARRPNIVFIFTNSRSIYIKLVL
jgi:hypothetical protein